LDYTTRSDCVCGCRLANGISKARSRNKWDFSHTVVEVKYSVLEVDVIVVTDVDCETHQLDCSFNTFWLTTYSISYWRDDGC
jgi:hypothetical protein